MRQERWCYYIAKSGFRGCRGKKICCFLGGAFSKGGDINEDAM